MISHQYTAYVVRVLLCNPDVLHFMIVVFDCFIREYQYNLQVSVVPACVKFQWLNGNQEVLIYVI